MRNHANQLGLWPDPTFDGNRARHFKPPAQQLSEAHQVYLGTPQWQHRRRETIVREKFKCWNCQRERRLQVHHLTYAHERDEWPSDIVAVCRECHERMTEEEQQMNGSRRNWGC